MAGETPGSLAARQALSFLPDTPVFYEDLSVVEHLEYVAALHGAEDAGPRIEELIERLGLDGWEDALGAELSKGMRQKVSIALALVRPFKVLLADEPLDGLDPPSRDVLFAMLAETQAAGAAIVVSTHRPDVIAAAGRCVAIRDGRLAYDGKPDPAILTEIFDRSRARGRVAFGRRSAAAPPVRVASRASRGGPGRLWPPRDARDVREFRDQGRQCRCRLTSGGKDDRPDLSTRR